MDQLTINGICLDLDILDADVFEKYQNANNRIIERTEDPKEYQGLSDADKMRKQCRFIDDFFDEVFGAGTAYEVFGGGNNLGRRIEAFGIVTSYAAQAQDEVKKITDAYSPQRIMNRQQRRAKSKPANNGYYRMASSPSASNQSVAGSVNPVGTMFENLSAAEIEAAVKYAREHGADLSGGES